MEKLDPEIWQKIIDLKLDEKGWKLVSIQSASRFSSEEWENKHPSFSLCRSAIPAFVNPKDRQICLSFKIDDNPDDSNPDDEISWEKIWIMDGPINEALCTVISPEALLEEMTT